MQACVEYTFWSEEKQKKTFQFKQTILKTIEPKELFKDDAAQMPEIEEKLKVK